MKGIYFYLIEDNYMKLEFKKNIIKKSPVKVNFIDGDTKEAISLAKEVGFFDNTKVVVLFNVDKKDYPILEKYSKNPTENNSLIVILDKKNKFKCKEIKPYKTHYFIADKLKGFVIDRDLIDFFSKKDLFYISKECEKIKLFAESKKMDSIDLSSVSPILTDSNEDKVFKFFSILLENKIGEAIKFYRSMKIKEGEYKINPILMSLLWRHFKFLMESREKKDDELLDFLKRNKIFYIKHKNIKHLSNRDDYLSIFNKLSLIEETLKGSSSGDVNLLIENFICFSFFCNKKVSRRSIGLSRC